MPSVPSTCATAASTVLAPGTVSVSDGGRLVSQSAFTPMLPGDEALISYGEDGTLSIQRSVEHSSAVSGVSLLWKPDARGRRVLRGAIEKHDEHKSTRYEVKNSSYAAAPAPGGTPDSYSAEAASADGTHAVPLYIDHEADPKHGGYVITPGANAIKQTTAFTRYRYVLAPQEEVQFVVHESASHSATHTSLGSLRGLLCTADEDVLVAADRALLEQMVAKFERRALLGRLLNSDPLGSTVSERELQAWREQSALPDELLHGLDGLQALQVKRNAAERQKKAKLARIKEVFTNQDRLRENIRS